MQPLLLLRRMEPWLHVTAAASPAGISELDLAPQAWEL